MIPAIFQYKGVGRVGASITFAFIKMIPVAQGVVRFRLRHGVTERGGHVYVSVDEFRRYTNVSTFKLEFHYD